MSALCEQEILGTSVTDGVTDLLFAVRVTGGGVDHVDPGIESAVFLPEPVREGGFWKVMVPALEELFKRGTLTQQPGEAYDFFKT